MKVWDCTMRKLIMYAGCSRILILFIQILFNFLIDDHKPDVFNPPDVTSKVGVADSIVEFTLGGFRRWDSIYMIHIAEHGYTYENTLAFFPVFPMMVKAVGYTVLYPLLFLMSPRHTLMVSAFLVNTVCFMLATWYIHRLAHKLIGKGNHPWFAGILFCFNPASIFMSASYSEASFALFSFALMYHIEMKEFTKATVALFLATGSRSNGLILIGYPAFLVMRTMITFLRQRDTPLVDVIRDWFKIVSCMLYGALPFAIYQYMTFVIYCKNRRMEMPSILQEYGRRRGYHMPYESPNEWCYYQLPYSYGYIQKFHWNVGMFNYYEWKQLPNFLLAVPVISLSLWSIASYTKTCLNEASSLGWAWLPSRSLSFVPYVIHLLFLIVYGVANVHIQIMTRMVYSSSPLIYLFLARHLSQYVILQKRSLLLNVILAYNVLFFILGTIMHSNFLPWT